MHQQLQRCDNLSPDSALAALPHPILEEAATQSRGDLRRREILDAAFFVFGKLGYERATLE